MGFFSSFASWCPPRCWSRRALRLTRWRTRSHRQPPHFPKAPCPSVPTGIGTTLAWTKDVPGTAGHRLRGAGPVILTTEGVTGLNPADGSTLWSYTRKNTRFCMGRCGQAPFRSQLLFTSPTGRYIAVQFGIPEEVESSNPVHDAMTVVLDTLTGQSPASIHQMKRISSS